MARMLEELLELSRIGHVIGLFERLETGTESTGIGLALVKRIIEVHGGEIWIESAGLGHGSTVLFTLTPPRDED